MERWSSWMARAAEQERLEALKYLGHWVGDIHQPLHVSCQDDRGGNEIGVSGGICSRDLHAVWDRCIIEEGLRGDAYSVARDLLDQVTGKDRATWSASTTVHWANESFAISISPAVRYCARTDTGCWYAEGNQRLEAAIGDRAEPDLVITLALPLEAAPGIAK